MTATILVLDDDPDLERLVSHEIQRRIRDGEYMFPCDEKRAGARAGELGMTLRARDEQAGGHPSWT